MVENKTFIKEKQTQILTGFMHMGTSGITTLTHCLLFLSSVLLLAFVVDHALLDRDEVTK